MDESFGGAVCIPNVCNDNIVKAIAKKLFNGTSFSIADDYNQDDFCQVQESIDFNYSDYLIM